MSYEPGTAWKVTADQTKLVDEAKSRPAGLTLFAGSQVVVVMNPGDDSDELLVVETGKTAIHARWIAKTLLEPFEKPADAVLALESLLREMEKVPALQVAKTDL